MRKISQPGISLLELLVVIAILAVLIALLLAAIQKSRESATRLRSSNNLEQIGLAFHNFENPHGFFPDNGGQAWGDGKEYNAGLLIPFLPPDRQEGATQSMPPSSFLFNDHSVGYPELSTSPQEQPGGALWQVLPYLSESTVYNSDAYQTPIRTFLDPARTGRDAIMTTSKLAVGRSPAQSRKSQVWAMTDYAVNLVAIGKRFGRRYTGPTNPPALVEITFSQGPMTFKGLLDGTSNTILVGGKSIGTQKWTDTNWSYDSPLWSGGDNGTGRGYKGWPAPDDTIFGTLQSDQSDVDSTNPLFVGSYSAGTLFVYFDGSVHTIPFNTNVTLLLNPEDGSTPHLSKRRMLGLIFATKIKTAGNVV